ncbi:hypothetical protein KUTeg_005389 [Tegillarca granosa]|uniref:BTB domain-containing protein n=1 Tax=Tegillarca granosa TaxID=220873 RepID=A0ABQ9FMJ6_TEGGR|nr:hypothetical protein KUTeg_005389 [Tegillarca granosa]
MIADVIMLVYSVVNKKSLNNAKIFWLSEIKKMCPATPVILVGAKADLRYLYNDQEYLAMKKSLLYRPIHDKDIVTPDLGRHVAKIAGIPYYECSSLTQYGIKDVIYNVVRAAVCEKRQFWRTQFRSVQYPLIQAPMQLPTPSLPDVTAASHCITEDLSALIHNQEYGDVLFLVQGVCFRGHKICLAAADKTLEEIFTMDLSIQETPKVNEKYVSLPSDISKDGNARKEDKHRLIDNEEVDSSLEDVSKQPDIQPIKSVLESKCQMLNHLAYEKIERKFCENPFDPGKSELMTVITVNADITPRVFQYILEFLYTGVAKEDYDILNDVKKAAEIMKLSSLLLMISNLQGGDAYLNHEAERHFYTSRRNKFRELGLTKCLFSDIKFKVDDGVVVAHKPILMTQCEMMHAMFSANFVEASADVIPFPGLKKETFAAVLEYLYTNSLPAKDGLDYLSLIEVANRLCLPGLIKLIEVKVTQDFIKLDVAGENIIEDALSLLEFAQLHNAGQLAHWCSSYLCLNYQALSRHYKKQVQSLQKENQIFLEKNRWPPEWHLREVEYYTNATADARPKKLIQQKRQFSKWQQCRGSCLCFVGRKFVLDDEDDEDNEKENQENMDNVT